MQNKFLLTVAMATAIICNSIGQTNLQLNLEKGETYKQITSSKTTIVQDVGGQIMNSEMAIGGALAFLVTSLGDSGYEMDAVFEKLTMSMKMPQGEMEFSSEKNDPNDILSSVLAAVKGKTFKVTMTRSGKITRVGDVEKLWEGAISKFEGLSEMQRNQIRAQLLNAYGEKALKGNIEMVTAIYPDGPVRPGETWTVDTNLEAGMSAVMTSRYEFLRMTSDHVFLKGISKIETADKDAYVDNNGMPMKYNLKGKMDSEIRVDRKSGWIQEARIDQEITGDAQIKDNPQIPGGMTIPMTINSVMLITN